MKKIYLLIALTFYFNSYGQYQKTKDVFGKILSKEYTLKAADVDSICNAVILKEYGKTAFHIDGGRTVIHTTYFYRIPKL